MADRAPSIVGANLDRMCRHVSLPEGHDVEDLTIPHLQSLFGEQRGRRRISSSRDRSVSPTTRPVARLAERSENLRPTPQHHVVVQMPIKLGEFRELLDRLVPHAAV